MLYPMFMLVILTYAILLLTLRTRSASVRKGEVPISYYSLFRGQEVPEMVAKTSRHFSNLFEVPVLFYAAGLVYLAMGMEYALTVYLAWAFVVSRVVHSCIHLGYNNVQHRLVVFGVANLCVLAMWLAIIAEARAA